MYDVNKNTAKLRNSSLEFLVFILTTRVPQPLNIFVLKNLDFGMGYLKFLKKDRKKAFKWSLKAMLLDVLQTEDSYIDVDTIIVKTKK